MAQPHENVRKMGRGAYLPLTVSQKVADKSNVIWKKQVKAIY